MSPKLSAYQILFLPVFAVLLTYSTCFEHTHCDDTLKKTVGSPDKKLVIKVFHRSCASGTGLYTYAVVKKPSSIWRTDETVCYLTTLRGYREMDVVWAEPGRIAISSPDLLDQYDISSQEDSCNNIRVSYNFNFKPPPRETAPDARTADLIRKALDKTDKCIRDADGAAVPDSYHRMLAGHRDREVLSLLMKAIVQDNCPISKETYEMLNEAARVMEVEDEYLEQLPKLVR